MIDTLLLEDYENINLFDVIKLEQDSITPPHM